MEGTRAGREAGGEDTRPGLAIEIEFVDVVETFLILIDSSKYVH
jgi:hypothetical protein